MNDIRRLAGRSELLKIIYIFTVAGTSYQTFDTSFSFNRRLMYDWYEEFENKMLFIRSTITRLNVPLRHRDHYRKKLLFNTICRSIIDEQKLVETINGRDARTRKHDLDGFSMQNPPMHAQRLVFRTRRGK